MKLSKKTLEILDNMTNINQNLVIIPRSEEGTMISTKNVSNSVYASAVVPENFESEVLIYELSQLLSVVELFDDPDIKYFDRYLEIFETENDNKVRYMYSAEKAILCYPEQQVRFPGADATISITNEQFSKIKKAASTLSVPNISIIISDTGRAFLRASQQDNKSSNRFDVDLGQAENFQGPIEVYFETDRLRMLPVDYKVDISLKEITAFYNDEYDITYWVGMKVQK